MGRRRGRDFGGCGGYDNRYSGYGYEGDRRYCAYGNYHEVNKICYTPAGEYTALSIDLPQQKTTKNKEVICGDMKIRNNELEIPSVTNFDFAESDATELEIVSAANTQTATADKITASVIQDIELDKEHNLDGNTISLSEDKSRFVKEMCFGVDQQYLFPQRSETSLSVRSDLCNVSKLRSSKAKEVNIDPLWGSCFELHLDFDELQNRLADRPKNITKSLQILHNEESFNPTITRTFSFSGQKVVSASYKHFFIKLSHSKDEVNNAHDMNMRISTSKINLCNNVEVFSAGKLVKTDSKEQNLLVVWTITFQDSHNRTADDYLTAVCSEASVNSRLTPRWRSLSLSVQNCSHGVIFTTNGNTDAAIGIGKVPSLSVNNVSISGFSSKYSHDSQTKILLTAPEHQKTSLKESCDCISLTELPPKLTPSPVHSNKSLNDSVPLGDFAPLVESHVPTARSSDVAAEEETLPYIMLSDTSGCNFNQTQISREEYVKNKANVEQKTKVELSKDELKKHYFVSQRTIVSPISRLEMQCFPNSICQFKYEDVKKDTETVALFRDQYPQTKEPIVTQSLEDTNRAVSVLNIMLQRRLNDSRNQNGSLAQERLDSFYSTPPGVSKSKAQKILNSESFARADGLNDSVDKSEAPLPHSKYLSNESEINKKAAMVLNQKYECIVQKPKENRKQYCHENNSEKTSQRSGSDGRSTIRDRLPRGQTRKLASLFETMSDAASVEMLREMDHLKRRGKSVPPNVINKTNHREPEANIKELFRDDLILQQSSTLIASAGRNGTRLGLRVPCKRDIFEEQFARDKQDVEAHSVRSIVNRFESVSAPNKCQNSPRGIQIDGTPRRAKNQEQYSQLQAVEGVTNYRNIHNVQYAVDSNYNVCSIAKSPSMQSDEWNECTGRGNPSHNNLPCGEISCANVWDQQQYELGLRKGIINLKRYDSNYNKMTNEIFSRDPSCIRRKHIRQMNYKSEVQPDYRVATTDHSEKRNYKERFDNEVVDQVAEVEKAFHFVDKTESLVTCGQHYSQESLGKPSSPSPKANYSISLYRDLEKEHRKSSNHDVPVRISSVYSPPPSAVERLVTYEHRNSTRNTKLESQIVARDPVATSTPLNGSPAASGRMHTSASHMLNRSGISSITSSTAHEIVQLQQSDIELQTIKQEIMIQEGQIAQASLALAHCKKNSSFNGTLVELSAQRGLLLARERLLALQNEMQRLKTRQFLNEVTPPLTKRMRGAIDLTSINVFLNRNFCIRNIDENVSYAFVILLKTDEQVEATQTVTLMDTRALRVSKVHFSDQIRFTNLPVDFTVLLEIYALKINENRRSDDYSCSMLKNKAKSLLTKKTCGNESVVGFSEFTCCGHICLNRDTIGMQKFYLDGAAYPLEGTIEIDSRCTTLPPTIEIDFRGFLTMYQVIAGLGSWARYWAVLRCGVVQFWKYPDDEASEKPALACMDLSKCTDKEISHAPPEICSRPNAFTVDLLVSTSSSLTEKKRVLLSADTKELCSAWLNALNGTLEVLRG
uniref:PH domain-containing protein n=1 Tax=Elaeophora elaphi TaxID=1147741 RepID=A0A158Q8I2_9BILA